MSAKRISAGAFGLSDLAVFLAESAVLDFAIFPAESVLFDLAIFPAESGALLPRAAAAAAISALCALSMAATWALIAESPVTAILLEVSLVGLGCGCTRKEDSRATCPGLPGSGTAAAACSTLSHPVVSRYFG